MKYSLLIILLILCYGNVKAQTKLDTTVAIFWVKTDSITAKKITGIEVWEYTPAPPNCKCIGNYKLIEYLDMNFKRIPSELILNR